MTSNHVEETLMGRILYANRNLQFNPEVSRVECPACAKPTVQTSKNRVTCNHCSSKYRLDWKENKMYQIEKQQRY